MFYPNKPYQHTAQPELEKKEKKDQTAFPDTKHSIILCKLTLHDITGQNDITNKYL